MSIVLEGKADAVSHAVHIGIVVSKFNPRITDSLLEGALATLGSHGVAKTQIEVLRVPGAFEVPLACKWASENGRNDAVIALSCIIRGGTPHFDFVANEIARGCTQVAMDSGKPVAFGVLTCDDLEQALARSTGTSVPAQGKTGACEESDAPLHGNKGSEAALAALEMLSLRQQVQ